MVIFGVVRKHLVGNLSFLFCILKIILKSSESGESLRLVGLHQYKDFWSKWTRVYLGVLRLQGLDGGGLRRRLGLGGPELHLELAPHILSKAQLLLKPVSGLGQRVHVGLQRGQLGRRRCLVLPHLLHLYMSESMKVEFEFSSRWVWVEYALLCIEWNLSSGCIKTKWSLSMRLSFLLIYLFISVLFNQGGPFSIEYCSVQGALSIQIKNT